MIFKPAEMKQRDAYQLLISSVVPRPIAFISSVDSQGIYNLAPFSFFMGVTGDPCTIAVSVNRKGARRDQTGALVQTGLWKDTLNNIQTTGEFVVNLVTEEIAQAMNRTAAEYPAEMDEFQIAGLTPIASQTIKAPRVAESPINMECKLQQVVLVGSPNNETGLVIAEVVLWHIKEEYLTAHGTLDMHKLHPIARLAANWYSTTRDLFEMERPIWKD